MVRQLQQWFARLSIARKLQIGFGTTLVVVVIRLLSKVLVDNALTRFSLRPQVPSPSGRGTAG
jgi:hypothetical protein